MKSEKWRSVPGYTGLYDVSNFGTVRSLYTGRNLKPWLTSHGYATVDLHKDGNHTHLLVHRLVAAAFIGPCPDGMEVNHIDENKKNNAASNLEYCSHAENMRYGTRSARSAIRRGRAVESVDGFGRIERYRSIRQAAAKTGANSGNIYLCLSGKHHTAAGLAWREANPRVEVYEID